MASIKSWISPDLLSHHTQTLNLSSNFLFICSNILFLHQTLKQLQQLSLLQSKFLFLSNKIFKLVATCNFRPIIKNLRQPLNLEQKILKHAATLKSETKAIKTCGNLWAAVQYSFQRRTKERFVNINKCRLKRKAF